MRDNRATRVILGALLLVAIVIVVIDVRGTDGGPLSPVRSLADRIFGPLEIAATAVVLPIREFASGLASLGSMQQQISDLTQRNAELQAEVRLTEADRARADELDRLLRVSGVGGYTIVPAQVVANGPSQGFTWTVTIDAGSIDGVTVDMCVINGDGLVGRVVDVGPNTSTVLLIVDATSTVGARMAGSREVGLLNGTGQQDVLELQLLDPNAVLEDGQALVTFGAGGGRPFAPGIPLGEVLDASGTPGQLAQIALVRPYVDISSLDLVGVVLFPPRTDPRDSVLADPPSPSPSPAPEPSATPSGSPSASPSPSPSASP